MSKRKKNTDLSIVDGGDSYLIFQCKCGCSPMALAAALPRTYGMLFVDPHVVEWNGAPALRTRAVVAHDGEARG